MIRRLCHSVLFSMKLTPRPLTVRAITQRFTAALERMARRHPEQYFWLHRRWKHQPKGRAATKSAA